MVGSQMSYSVHAQQQQRAGGRQTATDRMQQRLRRRRQAAAQVADQASGDEAEEVTSTLARMLHTAPIPDSIRSYLVCSPCLLLAPACFPEVL